MFKTLDNTDEQTEVPEFLKEAISNLLFKNEAVTYNFENNYSPARSLKKAHVISDESADGSITLKRYIITYVKQSGLIEIFNITEDKNTL